MVSGSLRRVGGELSPVLCSSGSQVTVVTLTSLPVERAPKASCVCLESGGGLPVSDSSVNIGSLVARVNVFLCEEEGGRAKANAVGCCVPSVSRPSYCTGGSERL